MDFDAKMLPCGHYATGETPYKFIDGWYLGSFVYNTFKHLGEGSDSTSQRPKELVAQ